MTRKEREAKPVAPCYQRAQKSLFERELQKAARAKARVTNKGRYWSHQSRGERVPMRGAAWAMLLLALCVVVGIARASNVPETPQPVNVISYARGHSDGKDRIEKLNKKNCKALGLADGKCGIRIKAKKESQQAPPYVEPKQCYLDGTCDLPDGSNLNTNSQ